MTEAASDTDSAGKAGYRFTQDWFVQIRRGLMKALAPQKGIVNILEIGAHEGRSTVWFVEHLLARATASRIVTIDSWRAASFAGRAVDYSAAEALFDHNIALCRKKFPAVDIEKIRLRSAEALPMLLARGEAGRFDFVYVDGSHEAANVLSDLVLAFLLTRVGGLIACDDYLWHASQGQIIGANPLHFPKIAIDAFALVYFDRLQPILVPSNYQFYFRKVAE